MTNFFRDFLKNESGAAAAEYVLILGIIGSAIALSSLALGDAIGAAMDRAAVVIGAIDYDG